MHTEQSLRSLLCQTVNKSMRKTRMQWRKTEQQLFGKRRQTSRIHPRSWKWINLHLELLWHVWPVPYRLRHPLLWFVGELWHQLVSDLSNLIKTFWSCSSLFITDFESWTHHYNDSPILLYDFLRRQVNVSSRMSMNVSRSRIFCVAN